MRAPSRELVINEFSLRGGLSGLARNFEKHIFDFWDTM